MKRVLIFLFIGTVIALGGCGSQEDRLPEKVEETIEDEDEEADNNEKEAKFIEENELERQRKEIQVYYIDENGKSAGKEVEIEDENDIWTALQSAGILTEQCKLLKFEVDESEKKIDLDFNRDLGEYIRRMGTTGEVEIIGCIVNTYLDAYECEKIRLTEEGQEFSTGHGAAVSEYIGRIAI